MKSRSLRLPAISAATDDWGNESWVVDCVCGVDFDDGEEMVDCDECGVWVHTRCSRYVKSEKLFACDKCKSKKLRKESEETEVAQLLVELPTKTLRMESPYPVSFASQNGLQVCSDIPMEEKVHVHGIPGGDTALFKGVSSVSSVFSPQLWKCTGYVPKKFNYQYREFPCWDIKQGDDDDDDDGDKIKETENRASNGADALFLLSKENGGTETRVDGSVALDMGPPTMKKDPKSIAKDDDSIKRIAQASDSGDAKQSASNEGKGVNVLKTDLHSNKHEGSSADVQILLKSDVRVGNSSSLENVSSDDTRVNPSKEATQMDENDRNQAPCPPTVEICNQTEDDMTSSLMHKSAETSTNKHDADDDINNNGRTYSRSNGTRSNKHNLEKVDPAPDGQIDATIETKVEINPPSDSTLDSSKNEDDSVPASIEVKKEAISVSQKVQNVDKTHSDSKVDEPPCGPTQPKGQMKGPESSIRGLSEGQPKSHKVTVVKSSTGKPSSKPSVPDRNLSGKQKVTAETNVKSKKDNNTSSEPLKNGDNNGEKPKRVAKDIPRSSHLSKPTTNASVSKKNSFDLKDSSGDSANSSRSESGAHEQNKSTSELSVKGEKTYQMNRQPAPKNHPPLSASTAATLSDEELALLLHQELNSSPRVPRVPRMRNAGSLPQLASSTPTTSTLMKRTSSSGGKDNVLVSRKRNKDLSNNGSSNSREFDGGKKVAYSRRHHEPVKNGSAKTGSSGPSSSNEANENAVQNGSDDETGGPTHRTLPGLAPSTLATHSKLPQKVVTSSMPQRRSLQGLIADIMSKGKRMTYEELCNAVLPHWPNLRKHNGERYAYSSHSQAVLDCLRNRSEWSRLVDRGPKTNAGRKRRKPEADVANPESDDDYSTDRNTKGVDSSEFPKSKRKARKHRRLALQGRGIKEVRRRRKAEVVSDEIDSSDSSEESSYSDEGRTSGAHEASASSDEAGTMS